MHSALSPPTHFVCIDIDKYIDKNKAFALNDGKEVASHKKCKYALQSLKPLSG